MANRNRAGTARAKERIVRLKAQGRAQYLRPALWDGEEKPKRRPRGRLRLPPKELLAAPSTGANLKAVRTVTADKAPGERRKTWCTKRHTNARGWPSVMKAREEAKKARLKEKAHGKEAA